MNALPIPIADLPETAAATRAEAPRQPPHVMAGNTAVSPLVQQLSQRHPRLRIHQPAPPLPGGAPATQRWSFAALAGRLVEVSGAAYSAGLTLAVRLTVEAQAAGDVAAWVCGPDGSFYPPDAAGHGVDLARLAVIRVPTAESLARAGIRLAQSGGFGLVVLDLTGSEAWSTRHAAGAGGRPLPQAYGAGRLSDAHLGRLAQQAQQHETAVVCLTRKPAQRDSLGSLVSVRAEAAARRVGPDRFLCNVRVLKDKRHGAGWHHEEVLGGPPGLH